MSSATKRTETLVNQARGWARELIAREQGADGKLELALEAVADRLGVSKGRIWALLYRRPPDIYLSLYTALGEAYKHECGRQRRKFASESAAFRAGTPVGAALARAARNLAR